MKLKGYSKTEMRMMHLAMSEAQNSSCNQRIGAVLVKGGKVIAKTSNRNRNHPTVLEEEKIYMNAGLCAERRLLNKVSPQNAKGSVIYVVRSARKDGDYATSKPCARCVEAMESAGVKRAVFVE